MLVKLYRLCCEVCGAVTNPYQTADDARKNAVRVLGWVRRAGKDLCGRCAKR